MVTSTGLADLPEVARYKQWRRRVVAALIVLIVGVTFSARPLYTAAKRWRARSIAREAGQLAANPARIEDAYAAARAAYRLFPEDPLVLTTAAQVLSARRDWASALAFWEAAIQRQPEPSAAARRGLVEAALQVRQYEQARPHLAALLSQSNVSAADHLLSAKSHWQAGEASRASEAAEAALKADPLHDEAGLFLAECLLSDGATHDDGVAMLRDISQRASQGGLVALHRRALLHKDNPAEGRQLAAALRGHPMAAEGHRLLALSLELRAQPDSRAALLHAAATHYRGTAPEVLRQFAAWLLGEGEAQRVLDLIPEASALARKDLLLVRLDAMAAERQWHAVLQLLEHERLPLEAVARFVYRARSFRELGEKSRADVAWRAALDAAGRDSSALIYIAGYAEKVREIEHARTACRRLAENPRTARAAYETLVRLALHEDTAHQRDLLAEMVRRWPGDQALANDLAYLNALLAHELPACVRTARELVRAAPSSLPHRTVLALAELRLGNAAAALQTYQGLDIDWEQAAPGSIVVYAATLQANGRSNEAVALASRTSSDRLRPEEQALKPL